MTEAADVPRVTRLHALAANPSPTPGATWKLELAAYSRVLLRVFDAGGRLIKTVMNEDAGVRRYEIAWDGRNASDETVSSGVYFWQFEGDGLALSDKLVVVR